MIVILTELTKFQLNLLNRYRINLTIPNFITQGDIAQLQIKCAEASGNNTITIDIEHIFKNNKSMNDEVQFVVTTWNSNHFFIGVCFIRWLTKAYSLEQFDILLENPVRTKRKHILILSINDVIVSAVEKSIALNCPGR